MIWNRLDQFFPLSRTIERYKGQPSVRISVTDEDVLSRLTSTYNPRLGNQSLINARLRYIQAPVAKCLLDFLASDLEGDDMSSQPVYEVSDPNQDSPNWDAMPRAQYTMQNEEPLMELGIRMKDDKITVYDVNNPSRFAYGD